MILKNILRELNEWATCLYSISSDLAPALRLLDVVKDAKLNPVEDQDRTIEVEFTVAELCRMGWGAKKLAALTNGHSELNEPALEFEALARLQRWKDSSPKHMVFIAHEREGCYGWEVSLYGIPSLLLETHKLEARECFECSHTGLPDEIVHVRKQKGERSDLAAIIRAALDRAELLEKDDD